jgi:hypothetical protein
MRHSPPGCLRPPAAEEASCQTGSLGWDEAEVVEVEVVSLGVRCAADTTEPLR